MTTQPFHIMAKPRGPICNLACHYCYYLSKSALYPGSNFKMSPEVLETYIRQAFQTHPGPEVTFSWQGGEPTLMGQTFFEQVCQLQQTHVKPGIQVINTIQTNGTLITPAWCRFFKEHHFLVGLSLDGPPDLHNAFRKTSTGREQFDPVLRAARLLRQHNVDFNILCCVHAANVKYPLKVYRYLRDRIGANFIQFIPVLQRKLDQLGSETHQLTPQSVDGAAYGEFLKTVFDEWIQNDVGSIFVQIFDAALGVWYGQPASLCVFSETCGRALALEHNGDLYACDHYVTPDHLLGNITQQNLGSMLDSAFQNQFGDSKRTALAEVCRDCDVSFICNGGCPKNRDPGGLNYLCQGYQSFFRHIDRPMKIMVDLLKTNRAPAEVMHRYRADKSSPNQSLKI